MKQFTFSKWVVAAILAFSCNVFAAQPASDAANFPQIIDYNTLMQLTPAKRAAYVSGLAEMMIEVEAAAKADGASVAELEEIESRFNAFRNFALSNALLDLAVPQANAQAEDTKAEEDVVPVFNGGNWTCPGNSQITMDLDLGTCRRTVVAMTGCSQGYTAAFIKGREQFTNCVPNASWNLLSEERRKQLGNAISGADSVRKQIDTINSADSANIVRGGAQQTPPTTGATNPGVAAPAPGAPAPGAQAPGTTAPRPAAQAPKRGEAAKPQGGASTPPAPPAKPGTCANAQVRCPATRKDWQALKLKFFQDKGMEQCIFAGNFNAKKNPNGSCDPVRSFSFMDGSPANYSCKNPRDVMCNPLIFSVQKDGKAFCVPAKGAATATCDHVSNKDTAKPDFLTSKENGLEQRWNQMSVDFNRMCRDSEASSQYHCNECKVVARRLVAMNVLATGEGCGRMVDWANHRNPAPAGTGAVRPGAR